MTKPSPLSRPLPPNVSLLDDLWRLHPAAMGEKITGGKFVRYPHIEKLSQYVARAIFKGGARIILSTPPRHGKSWLMSLFTPAWFLSLWPHKRVIVASYEATFAATWGRSVRNLIGEKESLGVTVADDSSAADRWSTTEGGGMFTTGVGGPLTGRGGDLLVLDDPIKNAEEANSPVVRESTWQWFLTTFMTRAEPKASIVIIMTRWHEDDVVGRLTAADSEMKGDWTVINLPAICESKDDFMGRKVGEALCPARYDLEALEKIRKGNIATWTSLYQGSPVPATGGLFESSMFDFVGMPDKFEWSFCTADTAYKDGQHNDFTVFSIWGVLKGELYLRDCWREQIKAEKVEDKAREFLSRYSEYGFRGAWIEPKGHGIYLNQVLRSSKRTQDGRTFPPVIIPKEEKIKEFFKDRTQDKVMRANNAVPHLSARRVHINKAIAGKESLLAEALKFPKGTHDDFVDTLIDAIKVCYGKRANILDVL